MSFALHDRLNRLLKMVETGRSDDVRRQVAYLLDTIPSSIPDVNKQILCAAKPNLSALIGLRRPFKREKAISELRKISNRTDLLGQVADVILQLAEEESAYQEEDAAS